MIRAAVVMVIVCVASACSGSSTSDAQDVTSSTATSDVGEPVAGRDLAAPPERVDVVQNTADLVELSWVESRSEDTTGYVVSRVGGSGATTKYEVAGTAFEDTDVQDGEIVTYTVAVQGVAGLGDPSEPVTVQVGTDTNPPTKPGRPRVIAIEPLEIEWTPSRDVAGVKEYKIERTVDGETSTETTDQPSWSEPAVAGSVVSYRVTAIDDNDLESPASDPMTFRVGVEASSTVVVVSAVEAASANRHSTRLEAGFLDAGYSVSWQEDDGFAASSTRSSDLVVLLGDVESRAFDWTLFSSDTTILSLNAVFVQASGFTEEAPTTDRLAQLNYLDETGEQRRVDLTLGGRPRPVTHLLADEVLDDVEVWARPVWSDEIVVAGFLDEGATLANGKEAKGCRVFFPGNRGSLAEQTDAGWELLFDVADRAVASC